jgi:type II secretory pathway pseudopilin PulG
MKGTGNRQQETAKAGGRRQKAEDHSMPCALCPVPSSRPVPSRSGITLLEVLISIGVLSVGVLGAASLLPMATYFQNETAKFDRGGALAQQAVHDLQIKNYLSPRRWIFVDPSSPNGASPSSWFGIASLSATANFFQSAFVIDPLGWAYAAQAGPAGSFPCYFPAFPSQLPNPPGTAAGTTTPVIFRAGITANDYWPPAATMPVATPIPMQFSVADRLMRSNDDVLFEYDPTSLRAMKQAVGQPDDFDHRPMAITSTGLNIPSASSPDFTGEFSWLATVSRVPSDMKSGGVGAANLHRFQVAVVVLQKRDPTLWTGAGGITLEKPPSERQVYAMFTQYGGIGSSSTAPFYGGGGVQLYVYEASASPAVGLPSRHWLDGIKPNTYLMLAANFTDSGVWTGDPPYPRLAWYRILNVDDGPNQDTNYTPPGGATTTRWFRNITISGTDWPAMWYQLINGSGIPYGGVLPYWTGADPNAPNAIMPLESASAGLTAPTVFCTLMDDAVAAYDDVITLDYSLLRQ